jgi:hypothetical protein
MRKFYQIMIRYEVSGLGSCNGVGWWIRADMERVVGIDSTILP